MVTTGPGGTKYRLDNRTTVNIQRNMCRLFKLNTTTIGVKVLSQTRT